MTVYYIRLSTRLKSALKLIGISILICMTFLFIVKDFGISDTQDIIENSIIKTTEATTLEHSNCEVMHLAFVCGKTSATSRNFYVLLKSILLYRKNPIHLHILVDLSSKLTIASLLETWNIENLTFSIYDIEKFENLIEWIPNTHYSGNYGLIKLVIPSVLASNSYLSNIEKVIVLDTDILLRGDIFELWTQFDKFGEQHIFGLIENQSDWYLTNSHKHQVWRAFNRGYNTGVILMNLKNMNKYEWNHIWRYVAETELQSELNTALADQDIFNAVIKKHPSYVYDLPCQWNIQINFYSKHQQLCNITVDELRLVHMNSIIKFESDAAHSLNKHYNSDKKDSEFEYAMIDYVQDLYVTIMSLQGSLLRRLPMNCPVDVNLVYKGYYNSHIKDLPSTKLYDNNQACMIIKPRPSDQLRLFMYFVDFEHSSSVSNMNEENIDVTLVTQLSIDRLQSFEQQVANWPGPISGVIYISDAEIKTLANYLSNSAIIAKRKNLGIHLAFKENNHNSYPINMLRNLASHLVRTTHLLEIDADFLPSLNMYEYLLEIFRSNENIRYQNDDINQLYVVPAFETQLYKYEFPSTKYELLEQLDLGGVTRFRDSVWPKGQNQTDYYKWREASQMYKVEWQPEYEPFFAWRMPKSLEDARFDQRFVGFGWNKVSRSTKLAAKGYQLVVLPNAFLVHIPHSPSVDLIHFRRSTKYKTCILSLKNEFLNEIKDEYRQFFDNYFQVY